MYKLYAYMKGVGFMKLTFTGKNIEVTDALKDITEKKLSRLDKFFQEDVEGNVVYSVERNWKVLEITINLPGTILRVEEASDDMYAAIDKAVDVLERQIRKYKTKLQKRYQGGETIRFDNVLPLEEELDERPRIVKTKRFEMKPMNVDEAILQMELLGHNFFVFMNADIDQVSVVYKRRDGNYGLIEPEF